MTVTALLVSHDGARWLPAVLDGLAAQTRPVDRASSPSTPAAGTSSADLLRAAPARRVRARLPGLDELSRRPSRRALRPLPEASDDEWVWLLHDDANPDPDALLSADCWPPRSTPRPTILGPKLREWPSLQAPARGRPDHHRHRPPRDRSRARRVRPGPARRGPRGARRQHRRHARTPQRPRGARRFRPRAADLRQRHRLRLARRARPATRTIVVPQAVVFHAEAAHRGVRRTPLTGRHTHYQERRAALFTLLANATPRRLPWQVVRLFLGSLLRVLGFLVVRSVGEALDELAAVLSVYSRPRQLLRGAPDPRRAPHRRPHTTYAVCWPRRGCPTATVSTSSPTWPPPRPTRPRTSPSAAARSARSSSWPPSRRRATGTAATRTTRRPTSRTPASWRGSSPTRSRWRWRSSPCSPSSRARTAFGSITGGALSPVPADVADWWRLHVETRHPLGTGTDVPAPAYVLPVRPRRHASWAAARGPWSRR